MELHVSSHLCTEENSTTSAHLLLITVCGVQPLTITIIANDGEIANIDVRQLIYAHANFQHLYRGEPFGP